MMEPAPLTLRDRRLKAAVSAIVTDGFDRFLLVKRRNPPLPAFHAFPGGRVEDGEDRQAAVLRELAEETGVTGTDPVFFARYRLPEQGFEITVFRVSTDPRTHMAARARDDAQELGWYRLEDALRLDLPPSMRDCLWRLNRNRTMPRA